MNHAKMVRRHRELNSLSREQLGKQINRTAQYVKDIEEGLYEPNVALFLLIEYLYDEPARDNLMTDEHLELIHNIEFDYGSLTNCPNDDYRLSKLQKDLGGMEYE